MLLYPVRIVKDGDGFTLFFPDIPHAHTNGATREDALAHAPDALQAALSMLMEDGQDIPAPGKSKGPLVGLLSVVAAAKAELYMALRSSGMRKTELARRMGIHKQQVERLLDLGHASRMDQIEGAFAALNKRLVIEVRNAA